MKQAKFCRQCYKVLVEEIKAVDYQSVAIYAFTSDNSETVITITYGFEISTAGNGKGGCLGCGVKL